MVACAVRERGVVDCHQRKEGRVKRETIQQMWESFWDQVKEPGMPDIQRTEMRRAFFAGCFAVLCKCRDLGEDDAVDVDAGADYLERLFTELQFFYSLMAQGKV